MRFYGNGDHSEGKTPVLTREGSILDTNAEKCQCALFHKEKLTVFSLKLTNPSVPTLQQVAYTQGYHILTLQQVAYTQVVPHINQAFVASDLYALRGNIITCLC